MATTHTDDTLQNDDPITSIADLATQDFDGGQDMDAGDARNILVTWTKNSAKAAALITARGMDRAIAEYLAAWRAAFDAEYGVES